MQSPEKSEFRYTTFGGLVSNGDPRDIGPGATVLENFTLVIPGQLTSRKGLAPVEYANEIGTADADILALTRYETAAYKFIVYQLNNGSVCAGREPSL